jgi:hypothetical protein
MRRLAATAAIALLASCACDRHAPEGMVLSRLYFGLSTAQDTVPVSAFDAFLDSAITPRFPDGLTRYAAEGRWRDSTGVQRREHCVVIEIVHPSGPADSAKLVAIADSYKRTFRQESVLLVQVPGVRARY